MSSEGPTATLLGNGDVVVAGGENPTQFTPLTTSEVYDPSTATWSLTSGQLNEPRSGQAAVELPDGNALVVGGCTAVCDTGQITATTEEFDAQADYWFTVGSMTQARFDPTATVLADGDVLVAAGSNYCCDLLRQCGSLHVHVDLGQSDQRSRRREGHPERPWVLRLRAGRCDLEFSKVADVKTDVQRLLRREVQGPGRDPPGRYTIEALGQKSFARASTAFK